MPGSGYNSTYPVNSIKRAALTPGAKVRKMKFPVPRASGGEKSKTTRRKSTPQIIRLLGATTRET